MAILLRLDEESERFISSFLIETMVTPDSNS